MEAVEETTPPRLGARVRRASREREAWAQLVKFAVVGASGFVVNLAVFSLVVAVLDADYRIANVLAYLVAVSNNFALNRLWTFSEQRGDRVRFQAARFFVVSLGAQVLAFSLLTLLVEGAGVPKVLAQACAILAATPLNFLGNKLWSFGR